MLNATLVASLLLAGLVTAHAAPSPLRELVVGQSLALTGSDAEASRQYRQAAQCFFDNLNRNGGIRGSTIRLVTLDDGGKAERTAENTRVLIEREKAFALFGYTSPTGAQAAFPLIETQQVPLVGISGWRSSAGDGVPRTVFHFAHVVPDPNSPTTAVAASYRRMLAGCGVQEAPSSAGLEAFIAARILAEGLNRAGSEPTRAKLVDGLESIDRLDVGGVQIGFSTDGRDGARFVKFTAIPGNVELAK